jgi:hypothetical protein
MQKTCSHSHPSVGVRIPFGSGNGKIGGSCGDGRAGRIDGRIDGRPVKYAAMSVTTDGISPTTDAMSVTTEGISVMNDGRSVTIEGTAVIGTGNGRTTSENSGKGEVNGFEGSGQGLMLAT